MSRTTNDVGTLNQLLSQGVTQLLGSLFSLLGIVVAMLFLDFRLALVCFTIIPAMLLTTSFFARRARRAFRQTRQTVGDVTAGLQEEIVGVREAQAFNRVEANIARFRERNAANRTANVQAVAVTSAFAPTIDVLSTLAIALVIGYGGYLVYAESLTVGLLAAFLIYVQQLVFPARPARLPGLHPGPGRPRGRRAHLRDPRREARARRRAGDAGARPRRGAHNLRGRLLRLRAESAGLEGRLLRRRAGADRALVGATGAGKTTIANLIPRFYDATGGSVKIDGHDVRDVTRRSVRRNVATVLQEPFLFSGTIAENISYGRAGDETPPTHDEIEHAARVSQADGFIRDLPEGYETRLGEAEGSLSQGQRQLLFFARAVLADPGVLILDEATSNIDTRTEAVIQGALKELLASRTSVVIAHRLGTIRDADKILVADNGRMAESGTHAELLTKGGLYADLYRRQFRIAAAEPDA